VGPFVFNTDSQSGGFVKQPQNIGRFCVKTKILVGL
jgi:hypothetical protein